MLRASLLCVVLAAGCGAPKGGKLVVDTPALPYRAPDIEELSGVSDEEPPADEPKPEPPKPEPKAEAPAPAPTPVAATPAKPATPTPAKPAGTGAAPAKK